MVIPQYNSATLIDLLYTVINRDKHNSTKVVCFVPPFKSCFVLEVRKQLIDFYVTI